MYSFYYLEPVCFSIRQVINGLPWWFSGKESTCQCRRCMFDPWVAKIPWRRKWQSTPVFLLGKSHGQRSLAGYRPWDHQVRYACTTKHAHTINVLQSVWILPTTKQRNVNEEEFLQRFMWTKHWWALWHTLPSLIAEGSQREENGVRRAVSFNSWVFNWRLNWESICFPALMVQFLQL